LDKAALILNGLTFVKNSAIGGVLFFLLVLNRVKSGSVRFAAAATFFSENQKFD